MSGAERRIDPEDGKARTKEELKLRYADQYTDDEIEDYFLNDCKPVVVSTSQKPSGPGKLDMSGTQKAATSSAAGALKSSSGEKIAVSKKELPLNVSDEIRQKLIGTELEGDALEAAMDLARQLYPALAQAGLQQHAAEAAMWCRMSFTKKLSDVHAKVQRLANYIELEDDEAERLCAALETALSSAPEVATTKEATKQPEPAKANKSDIAESKPAVVHAERRIDPDDGVARTIEELRQRYTGLYSEAEIDAYFRNDCKTLEQSAENVPQGDGKQAQADQTVAESLPNPAPAQLKKTKSKGWAGLVNTGPKYAGRYREPAVEEPAAVSNAACDGRKNAATDDAAGEGWNTTNSVAPEASDWNSQIQSKPGNEAEPREDTALGYPADTQPQCEVKGLEDWLHGLKLQHYTAQVVAWCTEMGAVSLDEVKENWQDLAEELAFKPLERKRLKEALG